MEYGYGMFKASVTDGCQYNTIKNCVVTLSRNNNAAGTSPAVDGSRAINVMNALATTQTTVAVPTAASGTNSYNKFYSNTLQDCNYGIAIIGYAGTTPFTLCDFGNDVGGNSLASGNNIINFGGATSAANPAAGVRTLAQYDINISYNTINNNNGSGVNHVSTLRGIYLNTAVSASATINYNVLSISSGATGSQVSVIENVSGGTAAGNTININNNTINNCNWSTATSGIFYGIYNTSSSSPANLNINNNSFASITRPGTGAANLINNASTVGTSLSISNNTFTNLSLATTGSVYFINNNNASNDMNISGNIISGTFAKTGAGGTVFGYYNYGSPTGGTATFNGNNFSNITLTGGTTFYGIQHYTTTTQIMVFTNNTISNIIGGSSSIYGIYQGYGAVGSTINNNTVTNITSAGTIYGLYLGGSSAPISLTTYNNVVSGFISTGASTIYGIYNNSGTSNDIYKNKVFNISASNAAGIVNGIYVSGGTATRIYNNFVSDLKTPAATGINAINGINISSGTTVSVFYNSVYLNAISSSVTNFGTSGIYANSTPTVDMRNNIIVNNSTANGTGLTVAYRRSSATLTNYASTSNNNDFYSGTPSATNLIFYDGANSDQTILAYQARVTPRETVSFSQTPPFVNTTTAPYDLHLQTTISTMCESGGTRITSPAIADDFDSDKRWGETGYIGTGTNTDVGADEFNGIPSYTCVAPTPGNTIASSTSICNGQSILLSLQNATAGTGVSYQWQSSDNGITYTDISGATAATYSVIPTVSTYYKCNVTCQNGPVTAPSTPVQVTFANSVTSTTPGSRCGAGSVTLAAAGSAGTTLNWYDAVTGGLNVGTGSPLNTPSISSTTTFYVSAETSAPANVTIGTGTTLTGSTGYPTAFANYNYQYWTQMVYTATELNAAGLSAGNITALTFKIAALPDATNVDYSIKIGTTATSTISEFTTTGLTTVFGPAAPPALVIGNNTITFATPYNWDGISNIIVDIRGTGANGNLNATTYYTSTTGSTVYAYSYSSNTNFYTSSPTATTSTSRLNVIFAGSGTCSSPRSAVVASIGASPALTLTADQTVCNDAIATISVTSNIADYNTFVWTPVTDLFTDAICAIPYIGGSSATTVYSKSTTSGAVNYICTANNTSTMCSNADTSVVTTLPASPVITSNTGTLCLSGTVTITTIPATGYGIATFQWQNSSDNITFADISGANLINYTTPNITSTTYYKLVIKLGTTVCSESNVATVTVNNPQINSTSPSSRCGTGTVNLTAIGSTGTTLNWYANSTGGSSLASGNNFTTPVLTATTIYYVQPVFPNANISAGRTAPASTSSDYWTNYGPVFNTTSDIIINNVTIYPSNTTPANMTIRLYDNTGTQVAGTADVVFMPNSGNGSASQIITLNYVVPAGTGYRLVIASGMISSNKLVQETSGFTYPIVTGPVSITSTWDGYSTSLSYYNWFYNWDVTPICSGIRTAVTAIVNTPPTITATATPASICAGGATTLDVSSSNTNYTYMWSPTTTPSTGASVSASPLLTTVYSVTATDNSGGSFNGCVTNATVNVTVNPVPTAVVITPATPTICAGSIQQLDATGGAPSPTILSENFNGATNSWITINNSTGGTTPALTAWTLRPDGYVYSSFGTWHSNDNSQFYLSNSDVAGSGITTSTILQSPSFSTVGYSDASLTFYHYFKWYSLFAKVDYTTDGANWINLKTYAADAGAVGAFVQDNITLPAGALNQASVKIRFEYDGGWDYFWGIDNVSIIGTPDPLPFTWSPTTNLFTDAAGTISYTGGAATTVYAKPTSDATYTATATTGAGCTNTNSSTITINPTSVGGTATATETTLCSGTYTTITLTGNTGNIQWQSSSDGSTWNNISGETTATLPTGNLSVSTYFRALVTSGVCATEASTVATVTVVPLTIGGSISGSTGVCAGTNSTILTLTGNIGNVVKWQSSLDGTTWTDITNTATTYTATNLTASTHYRAVVQSGLCGTIYSSPAYINASSISVGGTVSGAATICSGTNSTLLTLAGNNGTVVKWQSSPDGTTWTDITNTATTYTATNLTATTQYRAVVQSGVCTEANSNAVTITVNPGSEGGLISGGTSPICLGSTTGSMTLSGETGTIIYWQKRLNNGPWTNIVYTGSTYSETPTSAGIWEYRAVVQNGTCSEASSAIMSITVNPISIGGTVSGGATVCSGANSTQLTLAGHTGSIVKWQSSLNGTLWTDVVNTTTTYAATNLTATTQYRAVVQSGVCSEANAVSATVTVNPAPTVELGNDTAVGACLSILLNAGNQGASYLWTPGGLTTQTITVDTNGLGLGLHTISVLVTAANTCSATDSIAIFFDPCMGIFENNDGINFNVIPNPSDGMFYLSISGVNEIAKMDIFSISGQIVYTEQITNTGVINKPIDLKSYPKGMYFIRIVSDNYAHIEKIVVE